jgi:hypothetical protein
MDVKAGATVGFATAIGGLAGYMFGAFFGSLAGRDSNQLNLGIAGAGALVGAFVGGTIVAPTVASAATGTARPVLPVPSSFADTGR